MKMKGKIVFVLLAWLCVTALAACSTAAPTSNVSTTINDNSVVTPSTNAGKLNLNTASGDEFLAAIPGFGSRMVREFQEYRPYISIQQFRQEIGKYVDDTQVAEYEKYVYVPISINESDSETLQQIPGLDVTEAETLMNQRPFATTEDFITSLSQYISADELELARSYLGDN